MIKKMIHLVLAGLLPQLNFLFKVFTKKGRKELELESINEKLEKAVLEQAREKSLLKRRIIRAYNLKKKGSSKYIPPKGKNSEKIRTEILSKYGEEMERVNLVLDSNLKFK